VDKDIVRLECAQVIQRLKDEYIKKNSGYADMHEWVRVNIADSRNKKKVVNRIELYYKDCIIEYQPALMIFSIYKSEDLDLITGVHQGNFYDISLCLKVYLKELFGSADLDFLLQVLLLTDADIQDVSDAVAVDIDTWCTNIEDVFKALN
jgi:hypothetical protein